MLSNNRFVAVLCVVVSLMVAGCGKDAKPERPTVVKVRTTKVQRATGAVGKNYMGTIEEEDGTAVHFNVMGTVVKVYVDEGQFVRKGQALAEVDGYTVRNAHEMSLSTLRQAEDAYRRLKDLYEKGTLPEIKMVEMETMLAKARASEAISRKSVEDIVLRSPYDGYVASSSVHQGGNATPGVTGFRIVKIDRVKVRASIPEKEIGNVKVGQDIAFKVHALGNRHFRGKIVVKGVTANAVSHAYDVKALAENGDHQLLPGMVCNVQIAGTTDSYQLVIPQKAVCISGSDKYVWMVKGGKATWRVIETGDITDEGVVVMSGLTNGQTIIVEGQNKVCEGMQIIEVE